MQNALEANIKNKRAVTIENIQMDNKHMKRCLTSLIIRDMNQNHNEIPIHTHQVATIKKTENIKCWQGC